MRRREFISLLSGTAVGWPLVARAQQSMPVVGFLNGASPDGYALNLARFLQGLKETGYIDGQNVKIEYRWAEGHYDRLPAMAADLVHRQVSVIAATSTPAAFAAKAATTTIPIVFTTSSDPVQLGLVTSLGQPGGNVTGAAELNVEVAPKRLELLHELLPTAKVIGLLLNPASPAADAQARDMQGAASTRGLKLHVLHASAERDLEPIFASLAQLSVAGLVIGSADPFFASRQEQLAAMTIRYGVPAIYQFREFAMAGGLMSYGSSLADGYRLAGVYTGRILKGEKPADLPVVQSAKIELILNMKTAKSLGITIPSIILFRADEVIE
jgi:putative ABC transport system substrate-binding protein